MEITKQIKYQEHFLYENVFYSPPDDEPSTREKIDNLGLSIKQKFSLHYDFGDDWMFTIAVQDITETSEEVAPNVIKAKGSIEQYPEWDEEDDSVRLYIAASRLSIPLMWIYPIQFWFWASYFAN